MSVVVERVGEIRQDGTIVIEKRFPQRSADASLANHIVGWLQRNEEKKRPNAWADLLRGFAYKLNAKQLNAVVADLVRRGVVIESVAGKKRYFKASCSQPAPVLTAVDGRTQFSQLAERLLPEQIEQQKVIPIKLQDSDWFIYRNQVLAAKRQGYASEEEVILNIKRFVLKHEKDIARMKDEIAYFEHGRSAGSHSRKIIPDSVKKFVWQRDCGRCVICGSNLNLEFDHIIPVSKGGSNTARNIQLLCAKCNAEKSDRLGSTSEEREAEGHIVC